MSRIDIIRAWKDEEYRRSLSEADRAKVPAHPAGAIDASAAKQGLKVRSTVKAGLLFTRNRCEVRKARP